MSTSTLRKQPLFCEPVCVLGARFAGKNGEALVASARKAR